MQITLLYHGEQGNVGIGSSTLDRIVRDFVAKATDIAGESVIPANEPHPAPSGLYATVLRASAQHLGTPGTRYRIHQNGEDVEGETAIYVRTMYSINFYREGATEQAEKLRHWCSSPLGIERQIATRARIAHHSEVRRLDTIIQEQPEERAQIDIDIDAPETIVQNLGRVRHVPFDTRLGETEQQGEVNNNGT